MSTTCHRRERGYRFEKRIVDFFDGSFDWHARRLGGSSTGLPDIVITNNTQSVIYAVEAKSTVGNACYIDNDQICRCLDVLDIFSIYEQRNVVFAFKFASPKTTKGLQYWFFRIERNPFMREIKTVKCKKDGMLSYTKLKPDWDFKINYTKYNDIMFLRDLAQSSYFYQQ
jgi:Holliday junction resolvase